MGKSEKRRHSAIEAKRGEFYWLDPDDVELIEDKTHVLYDVRVHLPVEEWMVLSLDKQGNIQPIVVRKDGTNTQCVIGRQRLKAAREVNVRRKKDGRAPMLIKATITRASEPELVCMMLAENYQRKDDPPSVRAVRIEHAMKFGATEEDLATSVGCHPVTIKNYLKLLDCAKEIQRAIDDNVITMTAGKDLSELPRDEQKVQLEKMIAEGATKGIKAKRAVQKARGKKADTAGRMRSRPFMEKLKTHVSGVEHEFKKFAVGLLEYVMGDEAALNRGADKLFRLPNVDSGKTD